MADQGDINVVFVPRTRTRYFEHEALFHLLPRRIAEKHGLPLLRCGHWPYFADPTHLYDSSLPRDFEYRLSIAWADLIWRHLMPGSPMQGFSRSESIRLLAHNLDFWLPAATEVIQKTLRDLPVVDKGVSEEPPRLTDGSVLEGAVTANPRIGSDLWRGEEEAAEAAAQVVEQADATGQLRGILDAIRSNRVEDDFSNKWTYEREDFERKLYRKRSKVKVRFVELADVIPVQGPETEIVDQTVFADFLALLDQREQQVVILLHSGVTKLTEVAKILGYRLSRPFKLEGRASVDSDHYWMKRAIELARQCPPSEGAYSVGAVIVDADGNDIATGFSRENDPSVHAEEAALQKIDQSDPRLKTATLYSTLEPCSQRKSRPTTCTQHILNAGIRRVVVAWLEPSLFVADCQGVELLQERGVEVVELADLAEEAKSVNHHLGL